MTVLIAVILVAPLVVGQTESDSATDAQDMPEIVRRLAQQLDANQLADRENAERELVKLGPRAIPHLPVVRRRMPAEMKIRLERIRARLEELEVLSSTQASKVTLKGTWPLSEVIEQLESQTGNRLVDYRNRFGESQSDSEISLDVQNEEFWLVVSEIFTQANLKIYSFSGTPNTLAFTARAPNEQALLGSVDTSGLFRFEAIRLQASRDLRDSGQRDSGQGDLRVFTEIVWEPRVSPVSITHAADNVRAVDEQGIEISPADSQPGRQLSVQSTVGSSELELRLELPERSTARIASLKGRIEALLPGRVETFRFDQIGQSRNAEQQKGDATVILRSVRKNGPVHEVRLLVRFDQASGALESQRNWIFGNEAYLLSPDGNQIDHDGLESTDQRINEMGLSYKFVVQSDLKDHSFVYKTPSTVVRLPVEFEFKNLPLP